jgi:hypothetical protein
MDSTIPLIGVLLAALSTFVIGSFWYGPALFLNQWMKLTGTTQEKMKKKFAGAMVLMAIGALLTAYILAHFILYSEHFTGTAGVSAGLETAFWAWLGISLTTIVANGALEDRDPKLMVMYAGNRLVSLLVMGVILGLFM